MITFEDIINPHWILEKPLLWLTLREFSSMLEYSTSLPTGTTIGKRWKRQLYAGPYRGRWVVGEYVEGPTPDRVGIYWYRVACKEVNDDV